MAEYIGQHDFSNATIVVGNLSSASGIFDAVLFDVANQDVAISRSGVGLLRISDGAGGGGALVVGDPVGGAGVGDFTAGNSTLRLAWTTSLGTFGFLVGANTLWGFDGNGNLQLRSSNDILWSASVDAAAVKDLGLTRQAPELVKITDGSAGFGKLSLGGSVPSGNLEATLANIPTGATPIASGWLELNIEGTTAYVPVWI